MIGLRSIYLGQTYDDWLSRHLVGAKTYDSLSKHLGRAKTYACL